MRSFFFLLLLTNVVTLAWQLLDDGGERKEEPQQHAVPANQDLAPLSELPLEELPPLREGVASAVPAMTSAVGQSGSGKSGDARYCGRLSRIEDIKLRDTLKEKIVALGGTAEQHGHEQIQVVNYWVMLPPYHSGEKAAEAVAMLKQRRIRDLFIVRSGEYENAVSLGVFSTRERAETRYQQIIDLKARLRKPAIELRERPIDAYWISYEIRGGAQREGLRSLLQGSDRIKIEEMRCK